MSKLLLLILKHWLTVKKVSGIKHVFYFLFSNFLFQKFFAPTNFRRADIRAMPVAVVRFEQTLEWLDKFRKNSSIWNFTKIRTTILKVIRTVQANRVYLIKFYNLFARAPVCLNHECRWHYQCYLNHRPFPYPWVSTGVCLWSDGNVDCHWFIQHEEYSNFIFYGLKFIGCILLNHIFIAHTTESVWNW
jgi:hypothetical protein